MSKSPGPIYHIDRVHHWHHTAVLYFWQTSLLRSLPPISPDSCPRTVSLVQTLPNPGISVLYFRKTSTTHCYSSNQPTQTVVGSSSRPFLITYFFKMHPTGTIHSFYNTEGLIKYLFGHLIFWMPGRLINTANPSIRCWLSHLASSNPDATTLGGAQQVWIRRQIRRLQKPFFLQSRTVHELRWVVYSALTVMTEFFGITAQSHASVVFTGDHCGYQFITSAPSHRPRPLMIADILVRNFLHAKGCWHFKLNDYNRLTNLRNKVEILI